MMSIRGLIARSAWAGIAGSALALGSIAASSDPGTPARAVSDQSVSKALQLESQGLDTQRSAAITDSLANDSENAMAKWMSGYVKVGTEWKKAEHFNEPGNASYERYLKDRTKTKYSADAQKKLAKWCRNHGLSQEFEAHLLVALHLAPGDAEAQKLLGKKLHNGRWFTDAEWKAAKDPLKEVATASKEWVTTLHEQHRLLTKGSSDERRAAKAFFDSIRDPLSVGILENVFSTTGAEGAKLAINVIANIPHARATQSLVDHAVYSDSQEVRQLALTKLKDRSSDQVVPVFLDRLRKLTANTSSSNGFTKRYTPVEDYPSVLNRVSKDANARESLELHAFTGLAAVTAQDLGKETGKWEAWWAKTTDQFFDFNEPDNFANGEDYAPPAERTLVAASITAGGSCFSADTLVLTKRGSLRIGQVVPGDLVASVNTETGELSYKAVLARTIVPPGETRAISIGSDIIQSTMAHPFWVCGKGWVTARNLQEGDVLRCMTSLQPIKKLEPGNRGLMYNLIIADFSSYFVGNSKALVHDNSPVRDLGVGAPGLRAVQKMSADSKVASAQ